MTQLTANRKAIALAHTNQTVFETKKMLRLIRKESNEIRLSHRADFLVLVEVEGSIEIKEASEGFGALIAGHVVERLQALHDSICSKMVMA